MPRPPTVFFKDQRFGMLTVIERAGSDKKRQILWLCQCDCGCVCTPRGSRLKRGEAKSCGCQSHRKAPDLRGMVFVHLTVVERCGSHVNGGALWFCRCVCGNTHTVTTSHLTHGDTMSCGCYQPQLRHGMSRKGALHPLYRTWVRIRQRCSNPKFKQWKDYGGRGICVCKQWEESFEVFYADVKDLWVSGLTIDRINNDGDYEPGNVRWATRVLQQCNRRTRKQVKIDDAKQVLSG